MKKRAYYNSETQELKYFTRFQALKLPKVWEMVPEMENFINDEGKHQVRLHFPDFTVDLIETDESVEMNAVNETMLKDVEVIPDGKPVTN